MKKRVLPPQLWWLTQRRKGHIRKRYNQPEQKREKIVTSKGDSHSVGKLEMRSSNSGLS